MHNSNMTAEPINISVVLYVADMVDGTIDIMRQSTEDYAKSLVNDLDIPVAPEVSMSKCPTLVKGPNPFRISINGRACRISLEPMQDIGEDPQMLAAAIKQAIVDNRLLFLTSRVKEAIREVNIQENSALDALQPDVSDKVIENLVERCFRVSKYLDVTPDTNIATWHPLKVFDSLIRDVSSPFINVCLNKKHHALIDSSKSIRDRLDEMSTMMQEGLYYELGLVFPKINRSTIKTLEPNEFQIQINDLCLPPARGLGFGNYLVNETIDRLTLLDVKGTEAINPANGNKCTVIRETDVKVCESAGLTTWDHLGYMILFISSRLRQYAGNYLTVGFVDNDLRQLRTAFPTLVDNALDKYGVYKLTWILRDLVDEELSIRDLRGILDNLLLVNGTICSDLSESIVILPDGDHLVFTGAKNRKQSELEFDDYSGYLRASALKRYLSHKYTRGGENTLVVYLLHPDIEKRLKDTEIAALPDEHRQEILDAIYAEVKNLPSSSQLPVILTTDRVRRILRKMIDVEFPRLAVLSYQELVPDMNIQPIARISLPE